MATRSARGRRNLIMINVFVVVIIFDVVVSVATHQLVSGGKALNVMVASEDSHLHLLLSPSAIGRPSVHTITKI